MPRIECTVCGFEPRFRFGSEFHPWSNCMYTKDFGKD